MPDEATNEAPVEGTDASPEVDETSLAEIEGTETGLATSDATLSLSLGQVSGSVDQRDLVIPRLNIVHSVGPLSELFTPGDLVLNRDTLLVAKEEPLSLVVLSIKKSYEERLAYDPNGPRPQTWETREDVVKDGLWTEWRNDEAPPVREVATILTLVERPEGIESMSFNVEYEGKFYGLAVWTCRGTAYTRAAKKIFSASAIELANSGLLSGRWSLHTERQNIGGNYVFVPILALAGKNTPEFVDFIKSQFAS
jgi:hypothetical protein